MNEWCSEHKICRSLLSIFKSPGCLAYLDINYIQFMKEETHKNVYTTTALTVESSIIVKTKHFFVKGDKCNTVNLLTFPSFNQYTLK